MLNAIATASPSPRSIVSDRHAAYHPPSRPDNPAVSEQRRLLLAVLGSLAYTVGALLHPSIVQRLLRRIGTALGRSFHEQHEALRRSQPADYIPGAPTREEFLACLEHLKTQWGCSFQLLVRNERQLDMTILDCPTEDQETGATHLCCLYAGMIGEVAGERLSRATVTAQPRESPEKTFGTLAPCRITIDFTHEAGPSPTEDRDGPDLEAHRDLATHVAAMTTPLDRLSQREYTVLRLIGEGFTDKEIASALRVSVRTAENHAARIYHKLGIRGRARLIRFALHHHVVEL